MWTCFNDEFGIDGTALMKHENDFLGSGLQMKIEGLTISGLIGSAGLENISCKRDDQRAARVKSSTPLTSNPGQSKHLIDITYSVEEHQVERITSPFNSEILLHKNRDSHLGTWGLRYTHLLGQLTNVNWVIYGSYHVGSDTIERGGEGASDTDFETRTLGLGTGLEFRLAALDLTPRLGLQRHTRELRVYSLWPDQHPEPDAYEKSSWGLDASLSIGFTFSKFRIFGEMAYLTTDAGPAADAADQVIWENDDLISESFTRWGVGVSVRFP